MKVNKWEVAGYLGNSDYDGHVDDNFHTVVTMDSRFTKQDVLDIFLQRYNKRYRVVCLRVNPVENVIDTEKIKELINDVLTCDTGFNGEYIEVDINWDEVIEHLIQHGVIISDGSK